MTPFLCSILPFEPSSYDLRSLALSFLGKVETSTRMRSALSAFGGVFSPFFFWLVNCTYCTFCLVLNIFFPHLSDGCCLWFTFFQSARLMFKYSDPLRIERQRAPFEAILQFFFVGMCRQTPQKGEHTFMDLYNIIFIYLSIHVSIYCIYPSISPFVYRTALLSKLTIQTNNPKYQTNWLSF